MRESRTEFIRLNSGKCTACWKCVEACPKKVIGKINIILHKHAVITDGGRCAGCGKCARVCESSAIILLEKSTRGGNLMAGEDAV